MTDRRGALPFFSRHGLRCAFGGVFSSTSKGTFSLSTGTSTSTSTGTSTSTEHEHEHGGGGGDGDGAGPELRSYMATIFPE